MRSKLSQSWKRLALGGAVAAMTASSAFAATQGTPGADSTGSVDISISVDDIVQINGLQDALFGTYSGGNPTDTQEVCVSRSGTSGLYQIIARGSGGGDAFELSGPGGTVAYTVEWADETTAPVFATLDTGVAETGQTGGDNAFDSCAGAGENASLRIAMNGPDVAALSAGTYSGTLSLEVSPE